MNDKDFERIWAKADEAKIKRAADMPTEQNALDIMFQAWLRLKELGWNDAIYCPKDGSVFDAIECGSSGIHPCHYEGEWPKGTWWVHEAGDLWPSRPTLYRPTEKERADHAERVRKFHEEQKRGDE